MKLYGFPPSPNTWKVLALARHLGIDLDVAFVDLAAGAAKTPEFLAINPAGLTPVLVDGDFTLPESNAILSYLARQKPGLLPTGDKAQARLHAWQCWSLAHWGPPCQVLTFEHLLKPMMKMGEPDAARVAKATEDFQKQAKLLEGQLGKTAYVMGDALSVADFELVSQLCYAKPARIPFEAYPGIAAWHGRVSSLPAWVETAPEMAR